MWNISFLYFYLYIHIYIDDRSKHCESFCIHHWVLLQLRVRLGFNFLGDGLKSFDFPKPAVKNQKKISTWKATAYVNFYCPKNTKGASLRQMNQIPDHRSMISSPQSHHDTWSTCCGSFRLSAHSLFGLQWVGRSFYISKAWGRIWSIQVSNKRSIKG